MGALVKMPKALRYRNFWTPYIYVHAHMHAMYVGLVPARCDAEAYRTYTKPTAPDALEHCV